LRTLERFDFAAKLPKLYVVAVYQLFGLFLGGFVIFAEDVHRLGYVIIRRENVSAIRGHFRSASLRVEQKYPVKIREADLVSQAGSKFKLGHCGNQTIGH
jgi:hypothetical protein